MNQKYFLHQNKKSNNPLWRQVVATKNIKVSSNIQAITEIYLNQIETCNYKNKQLALRFLNKL